MLFSVIYSSYGLQIENNRKQKVRKTLGLLQITEKNFKTWGWREYHLWLVRLKRSLKGSILEETRPSRLQHC